jgi:hypothetical protein
LQERVQQRAHLFGAQLHLEVYDIGELLQYLWLLRRRGIWEGEEREKEKDMKNERDTILKCVYEEHGLKQYCKEKYI